MTKIVASSPFFISAVLVLGAWAGYKIVVRDLSLFLKTIQDSDAPGVSPNRPVRMVIPPEMTEPFLMSRIEKAFDAGAAFGAGLAMFATVVGSSLISGFKELQVLLLVGGGVGSFILFVMIHLAPADKYSGTLWSRMAMLPVVQIVVYAAMGILTIFV